MGPGHDPLLKDCKTAALTDRGIGEPMVMESDGEEPADEELDGMITLNILEQCH